MVRDRQLVNLSAITIERYLKVVHPVWAKNRLRKWMTYAVIPFAWVVGVSLAAAVVLGTSYPAKLFNVHLEETPLSPHLCSNVL